VKEKKLYYRYPSDELRLKAWKQKRTVYESWRSGVGRDWVESKRRSQHDLCFICLERLGLNIHVDHIYPLFLGGTNATANLSITHPDCNMEKGARVTMTYKEACKRRKLFNDIRQVKRLKLKMFDNPNLVLTKKHLKLLSKTGTYKYY